jgi:DNA-binding transcriptional ArsR family regulator
MSIWLYDFAVARAATTTDAFNAVAEPRRRQILDAVAARERSVSDLVALLGLSQPLISKHLRVLREVGLVAARDEGRLRLYRINPIALKPIYDWVKDFEELWSERFARMDIVLAKLKQATPESTQDGDDSDGDDGNEE